MWVKKPISNLHPRSGGGLRSIAKKILIHGKEVRTVSVPDVLVPEAQRLSRPLYLFQKLLGSLLASLHISSACFNLYCLFLLNQCTIQPSRCKSQIPRSAA